MSINTRSTPIGLIPDDFDVVEIESLIEDKGISVGVMYPGNHYQDGIKLIKAGDVQDGKINRNISFCISPEVHKTYIRTELQGGELLVVLVGRPGLSAVVPDELKGWNTARAVGVLKFKRKEDAKFISYALRSRHTQNMIVTFCNTTVQATLNLKELKKVIVPFPRLNERRAIAHILGTLDDKIELNRKMNETLEAMAQAMFKSWFVDFDPVMDNALAQGHEIPAELAAKAERRKAVKASGKYKALPKDIQALFPAAFVFNEELGKWIPEGWEAHDLGSITTELRRGVSPKYTEDEIGIRVLNQKCIRNHEINFSLARKNDPSKKKVDGRLLEIGDVLVNSTGTGTLGRIANVVTLNEPTIVDSHVTVVRNDKSKVATKYFNCLMFSIEQHIESMGEGSTGQTELSRARLSELTVLVASRNIQNVAEHHLESIYVKKDANKLFNNDLIKTRDLLLSQLISGKTRLPASFIQQFESQTEAVSS